MIRMSRDRFERMVREAEAALEELRPAFEAELDDAVGRLAKTWSRSGAAANTETLGVLFRLAHDLKGQGRSFGFDLLTDVAASLCKLLVNLGKTEQNSWRFQSVDMHVRSLQLIARKKIKGDGGPLGRELLEQIALLSAKAS